MAKVYVKITGGIWRNETINGIFPLLAPYKKTPKSQHVTAAIPSRPTGGRVKVTPDQFEYVDKDGNPIDLVEGNDDSIVIHTGPGSAESEYTSIETREEAHDRIANKFVILENMTRAVKEGNIVGGMIVSGPAGIGKSFGIKKVLQTANIMNSVVGKEPDYEIVRGTARPLSLYKLLYHNRHKGMVTVFDDCDNILYDDDSLNLLKAVLESERTRSVGWLSESHFLEKEAIPKKFEFKGSVIFLTNLDFDHIRSKKLEPHLKALKSRCLYFDMGLTSNTDIMLRIEQIMRDGLLSDYYFSKEVEREIYTFIEDNINHLQELSLRTVLKIAGFRKASPDRWQEYSVHTIMRKEAQFKWLLANKKAREAETV